MGEQLRTRLGWEVGFGTTFLTLLFAGYAPGLALTPLYGATGLVSLVVATVILRRLARPCGAEPRTALGQLPRRVRRPVAIGIAVAVPAMVLYVIGYALTHPLWIDDHDAARAYARDAGALERYELRIQSAGRAEVRDLAIVRVEGSPALQLERAGVPRFLAGPPSELRPLDRVALRDGESSEAIVLELRHGPTCPTPVARLDALWIRYTVLGMRHEQRIPLVGGPAVRCR